MKKQFYILIAIIVTLNQCGTQTGETPESREPVSVDSLTYAQLFSSEKYSDMKKLTVFDLNHNVTDSYYLIPRDNEIPPDLKKSTVVRIPLQKIVCMSTTHIAFVDALNETGSIIGVSGKDYVYNEKVRKNIDLKRVRDVGYEAQLDLEFIIKERPDAVFIFDIGGELPQSTAKLKMLGIPVIRVNEYKEPHILGVTEWIKFFAPFFEKEKEAETFFAKISNNYKNLKKSVEGINKKPKILVNLPWKGVWNIAGGKTGTAQLIADAGGEYIRKEDESHENPAVPFETIYSLGKSADIWINTGQAGSKQEILASDDRLVHFNAMKKDKIYNRNARLNDYGGNDCLESGTVRPDLILSDLITIFHPERFPKSSLYFYKKLE